MGVLPRDNSAIALLDLIGPTEFVILMENVKK